MYRDAGGRNKRWTEVFITLNRYLSICRRDGGDQLIQRLFQPVDRSENVVLVHDVPRRVDGVRVELQQPLLHDEPAPLRLAVATNFLPPPPTGKNQKDKTKFKSNTTHERTNRSGPRIHSTPAALYPTHFQNHQTRHGERDSETKGFICPSWNNRDVSCPTSMPSSSSSFTSAHGRKKAACRTSSKGAMTRAQGRPFTPRVESLDSSVICIYRSPSVLVL